MPGRARLTALVAAVAGLALVGAACGDDPGSGAAGGAEVERVELDAPVAGELVAVGDVLVAGAPGDEGSLGPAGVQVSDDGGRSWEPVELPGAPARLDLDLGRPVVVDGTAVVTAREPVEQMDVEVPGGAAYVWTSTDGVTWRGGELADGGPAFGSADVVGVDGVLLAGFTTGPADITATGTFALWRSRDGGASWQPARVPDLGLEPSETAGLEDAWRLPDGRLAAAVSASGGTGPAVTIGPDGSTSGESSGGSSASPSAGVSSATPTSIAPGGPSPSPPSSAAGSGGRSAPLSSPSSPSSAAGSGGPSATRGVAEDGGGAASSGGPSAAGGGAGSSGGTPEPGAGSGSAGGSDDVAAGSGGPGDRPTMLVSGDGGATWTTAACPAESVDGRVCEPPDRAGDLLYRGSDVSVDDGRTWQPMAITPPAEPEPDRPRLDGVVEDGSGGWLAAASLSVPSDVSYGFLLRSEDGLRWDQLRHPDPCRSDDIGRPNSSYSVPVRLGDGWLVAYSCLALSTPEIAELLVVPGAEGEPRPVEGSQRDDVAYGEPVALGDTIVVPERPEGGSEIVALSLVTP